MSDALSVAIAWLLGSIPSGFLLSRVVAGRDLRSIGSGGTGATNARRVLGWRWAIVVALADVAKGFLAVRAANWLDASDIAIALAGAAAVAGHCWPVWLGFRGGKGVATAAGAAFGLSPWGLLLIPIFATPVALTRYVSVGSLVAAITSLGIFFVLALTGRSPTAYLLFAVMSVAIIVYTHRGNIERLRAGTERRLGRSTGATTVA